MRKITLNERALLILTGTKTLEELAQFLNDPPDPESALQSEPPYEMYDLAERLERLEDIHRALATGKITQSEDHLIIEWELN